MSLPIPSGKGTVSLVVHDVGLDVAAVAARAEEINQEYNDPLSGKCYYNNILHRCNHSSPHPILPRMTHSEECAGVPLGHVRCRTFTSSAIIHRADYDCNACVKRAQDFRKDNELYRMLEENFQASSAANYAANSVAASANSGASSFTYSFGDAPKEIANKEYYSTFQASMDEDTKEEKKKKERLEAMQRSQDAAHRKITTAALPSFAAASYRPTSTVASVDMNMTNSAYPTKKHAKLTQSALRSFSQEEKDSRKDRDGDAGAQAAEEEEEQSQRIKFIKAAQRAEKRAQEVKKLLAQSTNEGERQKSPNPHVTVAGTRAAEKGQDGGESELENGGESADGDWIFC